MMLKLKSVLWVEIAMIVNSAIMFALNMATAQWVLAAAWLCAGIAWCVAEMKQRIIVSMEELCLKQQELIIIQHVALLEGGIILEKKAEEEAGPTQ